MKKILICLFFISFTVTTFAHSKAPHHGILQPFSSTEKPEGNIELKLHDDKGDLEIWITKSGKAFDLPLNTIIKVKFTKLENAPAKLVVRNKEKNEDEDGQANIRDRKTHYFIFPGKSGTDASFLQGKTFSTEVIVSFTFEGKKYQTKPFILRPHVH